MSDPLPCRNDDPEIWFHRRVSVRQIAVKACQPCPVKAQCLALAETNGERDGVWGGYDLTLERLIRARRAQLDRARISALEDMQAQRRAALVTALRAPVPAEP